ncbi:MAG: tripartite-type tricarboxylate transporter receptor subunit TctC [Alphaproteobacteria bacterium]|jgi:tripartite-type tricarboxylate transporter receptor subunit TctC
MTKSFLRLTTALLLAIATLYPMATHADAISDFYKSKQVKLIIGTGVGGGYDINGRLLARHLARHIPGKPTLVVQNMPGAGSRKAAGYVYKVAPKDGSVMAQVLNTLPLLQALGVTGGGFNVANFQWIGNLSNDVNLVDVWHTAPVKNVGDARKTQVILGATSPGSLSGMIPTVMNNILGTKFKIVTGYKSGTAIDLAVERGEVQGRAGAAWTVLVKSYPHLIKGKKFVHLAQMGLKRASGLENVPLLTELARNDEERALLEIFSSPAAVGKPTVAAPGVPADRIRALRAAYDATMKDPKFLADAERQGLAIGPIDGSDLQKIVEKTVKASPALLAKAKTIVAGLNLGKKKGKKKKKKQ